MHQPTNDSAITSILEFMVGLNQHTSESRDEVVIFPEKQYLWDFSEHYLSFPFLLICFLFLSDDDV